MKDQSKTEIKVGIMVVVGSLVFLWVIGWAKNFSISADEKSLEIKFPTVAGLEIEDPVTVNGVRKGSVQDFKVESEDVIVKIKLDSDVDLKQDATFAVTMLDLMGGKKINIYPGNSQQELDYSKVQKGEFQADIASVMTMLGNMQGDLNNTIKDVKITLTSLNDYLTDKQLNEDVKTSVSNLKDLTHKLNILVDENKNDLKKITSNAGELTADARDLLHNNKETIQNSINELQNVLKHTDSLMVKLNSIADETTGRKNNLGKLLYDDTLYNNLTETLSEIKKMTKIVVDQLNGDGLNVDANVDLF
ncbi:MAG TPA: MlaD family protein [Ignavibacteriaceae bacterium]|nr:MlaD family protein [Ignavibacteriaceae bacterium]